MDFASSNFLTELLKFFELHSITGFLALQPYAWQLVSVLAVIDVCTTWTLYSTELRMAAVISRLMKVGFFLFLILQWDTISSAILVSFQYAGLTAAGVTPTGDWMAPSKILEQGFEVVGGLLKAFNETSVMSNGGLGKCFMYLLATIITLGAFFFITLQILLTKIEFNVFASIGVILLPFGAIRYTSFLFQRVVSAVFSFGIKLMVMYFLLGMFNSLAGDIKAISSTESFATMLRMSLSYAALAFLTWQLPNLAASMMNGQPAMEAGAAVGSARTAGAAAASAVSGGIGGAMVKAASTYGNTRATLNAARTSQAEKGGSLSGQFAKTMMRQKFANSTIGKSLMRGANNAINHNEDFKNLWSGRAFEEAQKNRNDFGG